MKTSDKCILQVCAISLLSACSDDNMSLRNDTESDKMPITLFAAYPTATRASDAGFDDSDKMGVYVLDYNGNVPQVITSGDVHASNVMFCFNETDNTWKSSSNIFWTSNETPADIIGYYPYSSDISGEKSYSFSVQRCQDQCGSEAIGGYESSDFLWAKVQKVMPTSSRVDLTFRHLMAGIRVTLAEGKGFSDGEWAKLDKTVVIPSVLTNVDIDLESGSLGEPSGDPVAIIPYRQDEEWRSVVVPQTVSAGSNVIDVTVDGISYHLVKNESISYISGKLSTFTITVDKRADSSGYEFKLIDEGITAWLDDVEFRDGIVRNYISIEVKEKGSLKDIVSKMGVSISSLTGLKLTGEINEEDFKFLRDECSALKSLNLSDVIVWSDNRENVIPERAMYEKKTLSHIIFPKTLRIIGSDAFFRSGLTGSLVIPEGVEKIGDKEFVLDNTGWVGITNRGNGTFAYCNNLYGELSLPSTLEYIEDCAFAQANFSGTLQIPESVRIVGNNAFEKNNFTGDLILPESLVTIGAGAFAGNSFTGNLVIPSNISAIYASTFYQSGFNGVLVLPEGLRDIEKAAFSDCGFKGELKLPVSLRRISNRAFSGTKISSIAFPEKLTYW